MLMHQETSPSTRVTLLLESPSPRFEASEWAEWTVWEVWDIVPPSAVHELECDKPRRPLESQAELRPSRPGYREQLVLPDVVLEVTPDGTVTGWPGPGTVDET